MYLWRKLTPDQRQQLLTDRITSRRPWHSPPHRFRPGHRQYHVTAACYEHRPHIGHSPERMDEFSDALLALAAPLVDHIFAWCVLPNHYHLVLQTTRAHEILQAFARLHGRTSFQWNGHEHCRGRRVWCPDVEREMRSERHLWASINYVHHNPVKHGYVKHWQDWPWSSARDFLTHVGKDRARELWLNYPILDYGKSWDP